eukprot:scaffold1618_cov158-Ochromonas_danica.AAC.3
MKVLSSQLASLSLATAFNFPFSQWVFFSQKNVFSNRSGSTINGRLSGSGQNENGVHFKLS